MDANPGPVDGSVLYDQDKHVSAAVWEGQERGALRCHEHTSKLGEWKLTPRQIVLVEKAGFGYLRKIPAISLDNPLISALVERWRRETNTFHFTVGEMTVTLLDVALLLGLAIDGMPVIGITHTTCSSVCERLLGRVPDSTYASGGMVKLSWLKEFFSQCPENAPTEEVERCTRAYLLYLVGSTIFSTTTGNKVPVMYLPLFENFEEAGGYAWGAAALAFLYRALGNACVKSQSTICGCLTLLQCWSYFHLNIGRPKLNRDPIHDHFPFVLRWKGKQSGPTTNRDVVFYRKALDSLKPIDVEWLPYKYMDSTVIPEDINSTLKLGRSKTMLICFDKAERHLPDRCLRQYGMFQPIPEEVDRWVRKSRGVDGGVDLSGKMESELNEWSDRRLHIVHCDDGVEESEYMQWYLKITRKVVGRPISLSFEFQRTIAGLKEIAYLADSFSTKGLDGQQFESISRIRFISQDCLRDQAVTGSPVTPLPTPQIELGKRIRGKERVRRKGTGKRRRKDDPIEYHEASEDDQPRFYSTVIVADQLQLHQPDGRVSQVHLGGADVDIDTDQLSLAAGEPDDEELPDVASKVDDNDIKDYEPCHATNEIKDLQVCDTTTTEVDDFKPHDPTNGVCNTQFIQATTDEPESSDVRKKVDDAQLGDAVNEAHDPQLHDKTSEIKDSQLHDVAEEASGSELPHRTNEANKSQQLDAMKEGKECQLPAATEEAKEYQPSAVMKEDKCLPSLDPSKEMNDPQLTDISKEASDLQLSDMSKEANDLQLLDTSKEANNLQLLDATEEVNDSLQHDATKEVNNLKLQDVTKEANNLKLQDVTKEANESQLLNATKEGNELQLLDATKEANESQLPHATVNETQLLDATEEANESQLPNSIKRMNDSQLPDANDMVKESKPCDATKEVNDSKHSHTADKGEPLTCKPAIEDVLGSSNETVEVEDAAKHGVKSTVA